MKEPSARPPPCESDWNSPYVGWRSLGDVRIRTMASEQQQLCEVATTDPVVVKREIPVDSISITISPMRYSQKFRSQEVVETAITNDLSASI